MKDKLAIICIELKTYETCIWEAWRSIVIMWSAPAVDNMLAISLAEIGARL